MQINVGIENEKEKTEIKKIHIEQSTANILANRTVD